MFPIYDIFFLNESQKNPSLNYLLSYKVKKEFKKKEIYPLHSMNPYVKSYDFLLLSNQILRYSMKFYIFYLLRDTVSSLFDALKRRKVEERSSCSLIQTSTAAINTVHSALAVNQVATFADFCVRILVDFHSILNFFVNYKSFFYVPILNLN